MKLPAMLMMLSAAASADTVPRHISELDRGGFLTAPSGSAPEMTSIAGARFLDLVPDSMREVCRIVLEDQARVMRGLYRLQVVDSRGRKVMSCEL